MDQVTHQQDINTLSDAQIDVIERQIANKYMRIVPWGAVAWGIGNCLVFFSLFPLVMMDLLPLWLASPIATISIALSYLPSHEAQHNIIAGRGKPLRWLNELVGHMSTLPLVLPYRVLRATHMEHHAHTNDSELDPDFGVHAPSDKDFLIKTIRDRLTGSERDDSYGRTLDRIGQSALMLDALIYNTIYLIILFTLAWSGYALEAALLWWLPKHIAMTYISYYLSWAPHHPAEEQGRYRDTRAFKSKLGNALSMGMQYHIIHHLYPRIPLAKTPAAYREMKPILERKGCDLGAL
ncbi:MAG: fatty acid desaturase [Pseudomonadaceae bacterium]|nr:fatty acid desaturase [Pseudomonadaceae bacterium]